MIRFVLAVLAALLTAPALAQAPDYGPGAVPCVGAPGNILSAQANGVCGDSGASFPSLLAPYAQSPTPAANNDETAGDWPSTVWRANGETWVDVANGAGQAVWQKQTAVPLPADAIGLYVSAAAINAGGTGYVSGDVGKTLTLQGGVVLTISAVSGGGVTGITVTTPNMYGVCSPTTTGAPILANSGTTGTGATFNLTVLYPTVYAVRRVSTCYTGSILRVENSVTQQTKDIAYLADNSMDIATAISFGTAGASQAMENYANYNDGPTPNVAIWYDQGGNPSPNNATQATVAQQPVLFGDRKFGNSVAVLFNAQGNAASGAPYPSATYLTIPSSLTIANSANATLLAGGGGLGSGGGTNWGAAFVSLTPSGGSASAYFALYSSGASACSNGNTAGTGNVTGVLAPAIAETPGVYGCAWSGGALTTDASNYPAPSWVASIISYSTTVTNKVQINAGANCALPVTHSVSLTANSSQTYQQYTAALIAAINADPVFAAAGITAQQALSGQTETGTYVISVYQPIGSACSATFTGTGDSFVTTPPVSGGGWAYAGGTMGLQPSGTNSGLGYDGIVAVVPWSMTAAQMQRFRLSVHHHFDINGHAGIIIHALAASNNSGYLTPFLQDMPGEIPKLLGRNDVEVINASVSGVQLVNLANSWPNGGASVWWLPLLLNTGKPTNNIGLVYAEYNSLTTVGSSATEYAAIQTIGAYFHAAGWKTICSPEIPKNVTATQMSENLALAGLLSATPGNCDYLVNPLGLAVFDNTAGPWPWPVFTKYGSGSHVSGQYNALTAGLWAGVIRKILQ